MPKRNGERVNVYRGEPLQLLTGKYWDEIAKELSVHPRGYSPRRKTVIWPVDEIIRRRKVGNHVAERLRRLNPEGVEEGSYPRGWHRKETMIDWEMERNMHSFASVIRRHGREAAARIPKESIFKRGRRRLVPLYILVDESLT